MSLHRNSNRSKILVELLAELRDIAHIIDAFVEPPCKLRRNRLNRNILIRNRSQNDQQFDRSLRRIGLIHRDLRDEASFALVLHQKPIDLSRMLNRRKELVGNALDKCRVGLERLRNARNRHRPDQLRMTLDERRNSRWFRRLPDEISHIQREEVTWRKEPRNRLEVDMVRIQKVRLLPLQFPYSRIRSLPRLARLRADDHVLAIGLVPNRHNFYTRLPRQHTSLQLRLRLMCEAVPHTHRKFRKFQSIFHRNALLFINPIGLTNFYPSQNNGYGSW